MSYDIDIFSTGDPTLPSMPEGKGCQITAEGPLEVDPEDIPGTVRSSLPGIRFLTRLHLEGDAPDLALEKLLSIARKVARAARGVVLDQLEGTVESPSGVRRLMPDSPARGESLELSWFVESAERLASVAATELLDLFQQTLPEVLPRRYGLFEPPQFKLAKEGLTHFRGFLAQHMGGLVVWDCHRPCLYVFLNVPDHSGATPRGFRCGRLTLNIDAQATRDQAWRVELTRLWLSVADLIEPFYAEIRTGTCPTKSVWWNGIPATAPAAMLIGRPYLALWPQFVDGARVTSSGLAYLEQFAHPIASATPLPAPPETIAQPPDDVIELDPVTGVVLSMIRPNNIRYPASWPFEGPLSP